MDENSETNTPNAVKEEQRRLLINSLSASRFSRDADVILICGETQFPAHKLVLGAASPYFHAMFQNTFEETISGKVVIKDMTPETVQFVLDFIYLGEVGKIKTQEQVIDVMKASHLMQVHLLTRFCSHMLLEMVTSVNFQELWNIGELYENKLIIEKVLLYVTENLTEIVALPSFLQMSLQKLERLLNFCKANHFSLDILLHGILNWLNENLSSMVAESAKLFKHIDANLVSKQCAKALLEDDRNKSLPAEIYSCLKDIALTKLFNSETAIVEAPKVQAKFDLSSCENMRMAFIARHSINTGAERENVEKGGYYSQQFDFGSWTWLPVKNLPCSAQIEIAAACQYKKQTICIASTSVLNMYMKYNIQTNTLKYVTCENNQCKPGSLMCYFKDCFYVLGGCINGTVDRNVYGLQRYTNKWVVPGRFSWEPKDATFFKTKQYVYVTTFDKAVGQQRLLRTAGLYSDGHWHAFTEVQIPVHVQCLKPQFCFHDELILGWGMSSGETIQFVCRNNAWHSELKPGQGILHKNIRFISSFMQEKNLCLFITDFSNKFDIPSFVLEQDSGKCIRLPSPKGNCEISNFASIHKICINMN